MPERENDSIPTWALGLLLLFAVAAVGVLGMLIVKSRGTQIKPDTAEVARVPMSEGTEVPTAQNIRQSTETKKAPSEDVNSPTTRDVSQNPQPVASKISIEKAADSAGGKKPADLNDLWIDEKLVDAKVKNALKSYAEKYKDARVWIEMTGPAFEQKQPPVATYRTTLAISNKYGFPRCAWVKVEVRRYGRLLLGFQVYEGGNIYKESSGFVGYDSSGADATDVDNFYNALQSGTGKLDEVRRLGKLLLSKYPRDIDIIYSLTDFEYHFGDKGIAAKLDEDYLDARLNMLFADKKMYQEANVEMLNVLGYRSLLGEVRSSGKLGIP